MTEEITVIVAKSFEFGRTWLRQNHKKYNLDPQRCRITSKAEVFKGLKNFRVIWLRGWSACVAANRIRIEAQVARSKGYITEELAP